MASTAMLMCSFGVAPATMQVLPVKRVMVEGKPAATIIDATPFVNIPPFAMCMSLANPAVAAATSAALGVLTPMPCTPVTTPWAGGSPTVLIGGSPALVAGTTCACAFGGGIQIVMPGSVRTTT
ncbi:DUF4280 domain-containing protein [Cellulomonas timonensis]|uniref:DUF4280 domain-containing protein n=1 Tax=Cellulomonas timonensis TaxID=1689271 RepID=UPI001F35F1DB|nr:DUF4280 domain-containing protein [Cellulomonas timonensis]